MLFFIMPISLQFKAANSLTKLNKNLKVKHRYFTNPFAINFNIFDSNYKHVKGHKILAVYANNYGHLKHTNIATKFIDSNHQANICCTH